MSSTSSSSATLFLCFNILFVLLVSNRITCEAPDQEPTSDPTPATHPEPTSNPTPANNPVPSSNPAPATDPEPTPNPAPANNPVPSSKPAPATDPEPTPNPAPANNPVPSSKPAPATDPEPTPNPAPAKNPVPSSNPAPVNGSPPNSTAPAPPAGDSCSINPIRIASCIRFLYFPFIFSIKPCCEILSRFLQSDAQTCVCPVIDSIGRFGINIDIDSFASNILLGRCNIKSTVNIQCA